MERDAITASAAHKRSPTKTAPAKTAPAAPAKRTRVNRPGAERFRERAERTITKIREAREHLAGARGVKGFHPSPAALKTLADAIQPDLDAIAALLNPETPAAGAAGVAWPDDMGSDAAEDAAEGSAEGNAEGSPEPVPA